MLNRLPETGGARTGEGQDAPRRRKRRILRLSTVPTMLTLGNLVCGFLAIAYLADAQASVEVAAVAAPQVRAESLALAASRMALAGWVILLGMVFDSLDGRVARLTRTTTEFGGALDSLADVVTFGVAPAFLMKVLIQGTLASPDARLAFLSACFYAACATLRLARFNVEHEDAEAPVRQFVGLPTPGAAGVIAAVAICHVEILKWLELTPYSRVLAAHVLGLGVLTALGMLMVSRVPYVHVGNRLLRGRKPIGKLALLLLAVMLSGYLDTGVLVLAIFGLYALSGPATVVFRLLAGRREEVPELFD